MTTKQKATRHVLETYNNIQDYLNIEEFEEEFRYLTNTDRPTFVVPKVLFKSYRSRTFGKLLKRLDPIMFEVEVNNIVRELDNNKN